VIIDESDGEIESFPRARALGYGGVSSKDCKGFYKSLINLARCRLWNAEGEGSFFLSGEDLTTQAGLAVQQDLALVALLGLPTSSATAIIRRRLRRPARGRGARLLGGASRSLSSVRRQAASGNPRRPPAARFARLQGLRQRRRARPLDHAAPWPTPSGRPPASPPAFAHSMPSSL
jgi:hypothetical protein